MTNLTCLTESICSWNFFVAISDSDVAVSVKFNFMSEQGNITLDSSYYDIKHTWLSGKWSLESDGKVIAIAIKPNPLTRFFEISYNNRKLLVLRAESSFTRSFAIEQDNKFLGTIKPMHPFTRRATVDCSSSVPIPVQISLFWLTVLMWKRAAETNK
ncbi:MAG: hypothetical protein AAF298_08855 [Cyanobacteria bacterium P01_A01_bin.40]